MAYEFNPFTRKLDKVGGATAATSGDGFNRISAGSQIAGTNTTVKFVDSNGVTFGMSNSSQITASVETNYQAPGAYLTTAMASNRGSDFVQANAAFAGTNASGTVASNGISVSVAAPGAGGDGYNILGVNGVATSLSTTYTLTDANNVSFGLNAGAITASASFPAQTQFVLSNSNGVSFGTNGSTVTATVKTDYQPAGAYLTTARASNDAIGLNTAKTNVTWTANSSGLSLDAGGYAGTNTAMTGGSVTLNTSGISINLPAYLTTAMASNAATISNINVSGGTTSSNLSHFKLIDTNGVSWSLDTGSKVYATVKTDYQSSNANYLTSQSNQALSASNGSFTFQTAGFSNANNVTFGTSAGSIVTASVAAGSNSSLTMQAGASTLSSVSRIAFVDSNGISFGASTSNNGSITITGTVATNYQSQGAYLTTAAQSNQVVNSINGSTGTFSFNTGSSLSSSRNGNAITFGLASDITSALQSAGAYLTTARASNDAIGLNTAKTNVTWTVNSSGLSLDAGAYLTTARASNDAIGLNTAKTNVTWTVNSSGLSLDAGAYLTTAMASNRGSDFVQATAVFNGTNASGTIASGAISVSVAAPGAAAENNWVNISGNTAGNTTASGSTINWVGGNNITLSGLNNSQMRIDAGGGAESNWFNLLGANTAGNTTGSGSTLGFSGVNLTLSGANDSKMVLSAPATSSLSATGGVSISTNGSTISVGYSQPVVEYLEPNRQTNTSAFVPGLSSWYFAPFVAPGVMGGGRINNLINNTSTAGIVPDATSASFVTNAGHMGTRHRSYRHTLWNALYSQGTGTNSTRLESFWSNTFTFGLYNSITVTSSGAGSTIVVSASHSIDYIQDIGSDGAYTLSNFASAVSATGTGTRMQATSVSNAGSSIRNMLSNGVIYPVGFNTTISQGNYWMAQMYSTEGTSATTSLTVAALHMSQLNQVYIQGLELNTGFRNWGSTATTARSQIFPGAGAVYSATSAAPPQYIAFSSDLSSVNALNVPYFNFVNQGLTK